MFWLLASFVNRLQVGAQTAYAQSGNVFGHVEPVRANIGHAARWSARARVDAPIPVRVIEQPVLRIRALQNKNLAEVTSFAQAPHLLDHRVVAKIVTNSVAQSLPRRKSHELLRLRGRGGQRLLAEHVLASKKGVLGHGEMLRVRRADVDGVD